MPSPFPGMNPYLESVHIWRDFHDSYLPRMRDTLNAVLGDNYFVRIEENVYIRESADDGMLLFAVADATVSANSTFGNAGHAGTAVLTPPVRVALPAASDVEKEVFLEVWDRRYESVVTVIELLSPANKTPGKNQNANLVKRERLLISGTHLVEIDLLRGGQRLPVIDLPDCDYYVIVSRTEGRPAADLWPISLRDRLPTIPIPLRAPDADVMLDVQELLDVIYDAARYEKSIYRHSPEPALNEADAAWAEKIVADRG